MLQKRRADGKPKVVRDFPTKRAKHHAIQDDIGERLHVVHDAIGKKPHVRDFPRRREQHDGIQYDMNHRLAKYPPRRILKGVIVKRDFPLLKGIVDDLFEKRPFSPLKENRSTVVDNGCEKRPLWSSSLVKRNKITIVDNGCEKRPLLHSSLVEKNKMTIVNDGCENRPLQPPLAEKNKITLVDKGCEKRPLLPSSMAEKNKITILDKSCEKRPFLPSYLAERNEITNVGKGCEKMPLLPSSLSEKNKITIVDKGCEKRPLLPPPLSEKNKITIVDKGCAKSPLLPFSLAEKNLLPSSLAEKNKITNVGKGCKKRPLLPPLAKKNKISIVESGCGKRFPWPPSPGKKNKLTIVDNRCEKRPLTLVKEKVESVFKDIDNLGDEIAMDCCNFLLKLRDDGEDDLYNKEYEEFKEGKIDDGEDEDDVYNKEDEEFKERKIIDSRSEAEKILEMYDDDDYNNKEWAKEEKIIDSRSEVKKILEMHKKMRENLSYEYARKGIQKKVIHIHIEAAKYLERNFHFINTTKTIGPVPGVEIGDEFQFRAELSVIGLHRQYTKGIDSLKRESDGTILATSIVSTGRAANDMSSCDFLIYVGEGRNPKVNYQFSHKDQELEKGNLALKNSMEEQSPVRVVRKGNFKSHNKYGGEVENKFVYDGLYMVKKCWQERGEFGKLVFKFFLRRIDGQPKLTQEFVCKSNKFHNNSILMNDALKFGSK